MALCTAAQVRAYASAGTSADDTLIDDIIARVDALFARYCRYPRADSGAYTMEATAYTLYVDARYYQDPERPAVLYLPLSPVVSVTSVHVDPERDYGSDTEVIAAQRDLDPEVGVIILRDDATEAWSRSTRANKIVVSAGWSTVPDDLEEAAIIQAAFQFKQRSTAGARTKTTASNSVSVDRFGLLDEVKERLSAYRILTP